MSKHQFPSEKMDQYMLRFPDGLRDRIKELAAANGRSMNSQIIYMLQFAIEETEMTAGVYGTGKPTTPAVLRNEVRRAKAILDQVLIDYESGDLDDPD